MGMEGFKIKNAAEKPPLQENLQEGIDNRAYMQAETIETDGLVCEFLKVRHTKETAEKYVNELEDFVANSEVLISELAVLENNEKMSGIESFYRKITEMAEQAKILMVVPDPEKNISDALLDRFADIAPAGAAVASGLYFANKLHNLSEERDIRTYRAELHKSGPKTSDAKLISRREFLKMATAATVAVAGGMSGAAGLLNEMHHQPEKGGVLERVLLDSLDYRDACIAKEVLNRSKTGQKVSVIYGAGHYSGVKKFLENPKLLEERLQVYEKTYGKFTPAQTVEYDFREKDLTNHRNNVT